MKVTKSITEKAEEWMKSTPLRFSIISHLDFYNYTQNYSKDQILVIDFRQKEMYTKVHLPRSISIPTETSSFSDFIDFNEKEFIIKHSLSTQQKLKLKRRKRNIVILIPFHENPVDSSIFPTIFKNSDEIDHSEDSELKSLRNCLLFYKLLKQQRHRDVHIC